MKKIILTSSCIVAMLLIMLGVLTYNSSKSSASSAEVIKNIKKSMFQEYSTIKTTIAYGGNNDTPEGICVVDDIVYTTKIHSDGTTSLIKTVNVNGKIKHIMPEKNLNLGHANDITYYNGYLYIAGLNNKFYCVKDKGLNSKGFERYAVKSYTCSNVSLTTDASRYSTASWNITHYSGKYFIFCSAIDSSRYMTFRVGYFNNDTSKFVVTKSFTARAKAFTTLQGITYNNGYLYQTTSDNANTGNMNKISEYYIGPNYSQIKNSYAVTHYGTFDNLEVEKYEIESIAFDQANKLYVLVNVKGRNDYIYKSKTNIVM